MILSAHDVGTPTWNKIKEWYGPILAKKRARIENPRIAEPERVQLAWQIDTIKEFLALGEPDAKETAAD